ncbi:hypothetical protein EUAN_12650 [Andreesenia angusta]|uniref:Uncharacterized protein n=1 Tax=Andreesenia angusta TaxID=39480 RepID=A0A1S1V6C8_9FIRM|nr:hypothetical protein [Andreesenia angusta]OHW62196.1 hypothetical protein EUAN_12650 [Andreesenia angusta]
MEGGNLKIKKVMTEKAEEALVNIILEQVRKNGMTILNVEEVTTRVISYLESNATLSEKDSEQSESLL